MVVACLNISGIRLERLKKMINKFSGEISHPRFEPSTMRTQIACVCDESMCLIKCASENSQLAWCFHSSKGLDLKCLHTVSATDVHTRFTYLKYGLKRPEREADNSPPAIHEVKNARIYTSTPQYVFMVWCLTKQWIHLYCVVLRQIYLTRICCLCVEIREAEQQKCNSEKQNNVCNWETERHVMIENCFCKTSYFGLYYVHRFSLQEFKNLIVASYLRILTGKKIYIRTNTHTHTHTHTQRWLPKAMHYTAEI